MKEFLRLWLASLTILWAVAGVIALGVLINQRVESDLATWAYISALVAGLFAAGEATE